MRTEKNLNNVYCFAFIVALIMPLAIKAVVSGLYYSFGMFLYWSVIVGAIVLYLPRVHTPGRLVSKDMVLIMAISGAVIHISLMFMAGVILKQLKASPYDHSITGIFYNIINLVPLIFAREYIREYLIANIWKNKKYRIVLLVLMVIFISLIEINFPKADQIKSIETLVIYVAENIVPIFSKNILLTVLVFYGGAKAGVGYAIIMQLFQRLSPILPDLVWLANAAIGFIFPVIYSMIVSQSSKISEGEVVREENKTSFSYIVALCMSIAFAWFCIGVFPIYPSIILTGSMEPLIKPGDAVLIEKVFEEKTIDELKVGDIINFNRDDINITHRIVEVIVDEAGNRSFRTKGDNNKSEDVRLVLPNDINGVVNRTVPKVGVIVLLLKGQNDIPEGVVDSGE